MYKKLRLPLTTLGRGENDVSFDYAYSAVVVGLWPEKISLTALLKAVNHCRD